MWKKVNVGEKARWLLSRSSVKAWLRQLSSYTVAFDALRRCAHAGLTRYSTFVDHVLRNFLVTEVKQYRVDFEVRSACVVIMLGRELCDHGKVEACRHALKNCKKPQLDKLLRLGRPSLA